MSKKIGFLQRWMFIIDKINAHPYISMKELERAIRTELPAYDGAEEVGTNPRTIRRDLEEIRNSSYMDISIEYSRRHRGYFIPRDEKSISKLDRLFELSSLLSFTSLKDIVFVEERKPRGLEHRFGLINAIRNTVEVLVDYRKFGKIDIPQAPRRLQPYALREFKNRWYLLAKEAKGDSPAHGDIKIWGLDRIESLTVTNRKFAKDESIDLKKKFEHCYGIYSNDELKPERVVLSFSPLSGRYADSLPLHESQKTLVRNDKEFRIN